MELKRSSKLVYGLLLGAWLLVVGWQVEEHFRVVEAGKSDLRNRSHEIANTLSAVTRALRFRGTIFQERLEPVLNELVTSRTNAIFNSGGLLSVGLLNPEGEPVVAAGDTNLLAGVNVSEREHWAGGAVIFVLPIEGASVNPEGATNNATVLLPAFRSLTNGAPRDRDFPRHEPRPGEVNGTNEMAFPPSNFPPSAVDALDE
jgi:hypothetical protein